MKILASLIRTIGSSWRTPMRPLCQRLKKRAPLPQAESAFAPPILLVTVSSGGTKVYRELAVPHLYPQP